MAGFLITRVLPVFAGAMLFSGTAGAVIGTAGTVIGTAGASTANVQSASVLQPSETAWLLVSGATASLAELQAAAERHGGQVTWSSVLVPGVRTVACPAGSAGLLAAELSKVPGVSYAKVSEVHETQEQTTPYGIGLVSAPQFWAASTAPRGRGAVVAVLDTGIASAHPDLPVPVISRSFISGETTFDGNSHGTHCSGTVLALDNSEGVVGVAPQADLMIGKVLSNSGSGSTAGIIQAIEWATLNGADVMSMSFGGGGFEQPFQDIINAAWGAGVVMIAASGNSASSGMFYPAWYENIISVGAVDSGSNLASFSNIGATISVVAPGVSVLSTTPAASTVSVGWSGVNRAAAALAGSAVGVVTEGAIFCGFGGAAADFPAAVSGKVAHIRRGGLDAAGNRFTFIAKTRNAIDAGAIGVVISNDAGGVFSGTLNATIGIPVVSISQVDGDALQVADGVVTTVSNVLGAAGGGYGSKSGTSMACPHVAGVAGLLIGEFQARGITPAQVRLAMEQSATDLGVAGRDDTFGYGLVNAAAARTLLDSTLPPPCTADVAGGAVRPDGSASPDGVVDGSDFVAFINAFAAAASLADLDGGGVVDGADFVLFVNSFGAGC